jgi:hypothetical protein
METLENIELNFAYKKVYLAPRFDIVKLDNEISLVLNSFNSLPGDPNPNCVTEGGDNQFAESPWE